jgi:hypothetical protein
MYSHRIVDAHYVSKEVKRSEERKRKKQEGENGRKV